MRSLRWIRILTATIVFCLITAVYFGRSEGQFLIDAQLVPSFLNGLSLLTVGGIAFVLISGLTLLVGRIYCSVLCPLGILQDLIARVSKFGKRRKRYHRQPALRWLQWGIALLLLLPLFVGSAAAIGLLDPYSLFSRAFNSLVTPTVALINNSGALLLRDSELHWFIPVKLYTPPLWSLLLTSSLVLLLVAMVVWNGRVFCNTLCPAGAYLRLLSRFSFFQLTIRGTLCNRCGSCQKACKAGCIDRITKSIDFERCVLCFNCVDSCDKNGVHFELNPMWKRSRSPRHSETPSTHNHASPLSTAALVPLPRREFLRASATVATLALTGETLHAQGHRRNAQDQGEPPSHFRYRDTLPPTLPPGAINLEHFQSHCTACQLCVNQCPTHALTPSFLELGWKSVQQPIFEFSRGYCFYECNTCTQICPTGALTPLDLEIKKTTRIGIAHLFREQCVVHTKGTECGACIEHCPAIALTGVPYGDTNPNLLLPQINADLCIGCGICDYICPETPSAIRVEGYAVHEQAQKKAIEPLTTGPDLSEEFPF